MKRDGRPHHGPDDASAHTVEGYLLARTHREQARREAEDLCTRMPWLTTAQAEDVTAHYLHRRMELTRHILLTTAERAGQLREEYETRYTALRRSLLRRHTACACVLLTCAAGLGALASVSFR
ncbi:hypothetical protein [Streptomyces sp. MA5143a]|uniref:hypothetical protein n=1 Tax=Streptomyces sp. MA5143a TaxID=2083010 RepID=UPI000D19D22C|nr:hypothetical protein [Streptomyces sp. MA5143a]SPE99877.1 hypothetical protein SMA5143A_0586 [Streptomyces sp. MA5143a]